MKAAPTPPRTHATHALLAGVAAAAAWYFADRPLEAAFRARQAALERARQEVFDNELTASSESDLPEIIRSLEERRAALYARAAKSGDMAGLYEAFRGLAADRGVRINRVEPTASHRLPANQALADREPLGETFGYAVEVSGTYAAIAGFIGACERELGASRVGGFRISAEGPTPAGAEPTLTALVETVHLKLTPKVASAGDTP